MDFNFDNGGVYGSDLPSGIKPRGSKMRPRRSLRFRSSSPPYFPHLTGDGFGAVDIIFIILLAAAVVFAVINWSTVSDYLFFNIMMPIIDILTKIIGVVLTGAVCYGFITRKIKNRKRANYFFGRGGLF